MEKSALVQAMQATMPQNSVGKYDLLSLFVKKEILYAAAETLGSGFSGCVEYVVAPEALGWILGTAIAQTIGAGFAGIRKAENLPYDAKDIFTVSFTDYSGKWKRLGAPLHWAAAGKRVLIVDDWIETGSQIEAVLRICKEFQCSVAGIAALGSDRCAKVREWEAQGVLRCIGYDL